MVSNKDERRNVTIGVRSVADAKRYLVQVPCRTKDVLYCRLE